MRDPARREQARRDVRIGQRILRGAGHEEIADGVDRHDDDREAAQHIDVAQPIRARVSGITNHRCNRLDGRTLPDDDLGLRGEAAST
jgi:hypothetical protein